MVYPQSPFTNKFDIDCLRCLHKVDDTADKNQVCKLSLARNLNDCHYFYFLGCKLGKTTSLALCFA